jgi:GT2 family glycosyltransferase
MMQGFHIACVVLAWLLAFAWVVKYVEAAQGLPKLPNLWDPIFDQNLEPGPRVAVIVPARNEAGGVETCIRSLLAQDYAPLHILAVNDRSTDGTGGALEAIAAISPSGRVAVLHIRDLPQDWLGKTHAMAVAANAAIESCNPEYLLFTDADIDFAPDAVRRSVVAAQRSRADHLVTLPTTLARTGGEALLLSFLQVVAMWAVRSWRAADPNAKRDAVGVGAFNMVRTSAYLQIGGFEAMRMEIVEDLALARRMKSAGLRQCVAVAPRLISLHWASGPAGIVRGLTKNIFAVFDYRVPAVLLAATGLTLLCIAPAVLLAVPGARVPAILAWAAAAGLYRLSGRISKLPAWFAAGMPLGALLVLYAMLRSTLITLIDGGVTWRGTFYSLADLRRSRVLSRSVIQRTPPAV